MKKGLALIVVIFLVVTILPYVFANGDDDSKESEMRSSLLKLRERAEDEVDFRLRQISEDDKERILTKFNEYNNVYRNALKDSIRFKLQLMLKKDAILKCKNNLDTEECKILQNEVRALTKDYLLNVADTLIAHLQRIKEKVLSSEELEEGEVNEIVNNIDSKISELEKVKLEIRDADSREKLIEVVKNMRTILKDVKIESDEDVGKLRKGHIGEIIKRSEKLEIKLQRVLEKFDNDGQNITNIQPLIDDFNKKISDAREHYNLAIELFDKAKQFERTNETNQTIEVRHQYIKDAHEHLRVAHNDLKEANEILKQIFRALKGIDDDVEEEIKRDRCWSDRPGFKPGEDLGYFIWQSSCEDKAWFIDWSGNARLFGDNSKEEDKDQIVPPRDGSVTLPTGWHAMRGVIKTDGRFLDVGQLAFEKNDMYSVSDNEITFRAIVGTHFDGLHFKSTGNKITFDLYVDNEQQKSLVFIGNDLRNPSDIPFELSGTNVVIKERVCEEGKILYRGECLEHMRNKETQQITSTGSSDRNTGSSDRGSY